MTNTSCPGLRCSQGRGRKLTKVVQLLPELVTEPFTVFPEYWKPPVLPVMAREPEIVLPVKLTPPVSAVTEALPVMVLPDTTRPPPLEEMASEPVRWLFCKLTPPLLEVMLKLPPMLVWAVMTTGPADPVNPAASVLIRRCRRGRRTPNLPAGRRSRLP